MKLAQKVGDIITGRLVYVAPDDDIIKAARLMAEQNISSLLVKDRGDFIGILTEKDIIKKVVAEGVYPGGIKAGDIMSSPIKTVPINEGVEKAAELMKKESVRRLVVTEEDDMVGIITETDITHYLDSVLVLINR